MTTKEQIIADLEKAYEIAKYIHSRLDHYKIWSIWKEYFKESPHSFHTQTLSGLYIEGYYSTLSRIHTPIGVWSILGISSVKPNSWKGLI